MRIFEIIIDVADDISNGFITPDEILYWIGRAIGWVTIFGIGFAVGSIIRGLLQGFGII